MDRNLMKKEDKLYSSGKEKKYSCHFCPNRFRCDYYTYWLYNPVFSPKKLDCKYWLFAFCYE